LNAGGYALELHEGPIWHGRQRGPQFLCASFIGTQKDQKLHQNGSDVESRDNGTDHEWFNVGV
jgi:hypothetical protein